MKGDVNDHLSLKHKVYANTASRIHLDAYVQQMLQRSDASLSGVLVSGNAGAGKTFLVEHYLEKYESSHPVLIARHYQQHQNIPYFGFKFSIADYLSNVYNQSSKATLQKFSDGLRSHLGDSFLLLSDYIPEISLIFGKETPVQTSFLTVENQLHPLFKKLFEFMASYFQKPVLFFTDDLQWIDASGLNLLKYLLLNLTTERFIWIGACRVEQNKSSLFNQFSEELQFSKIRFENIVLKGLTKAEVKLLVETTLSGPCEDNLIETCYTISEGNLSHLQALLESLKASSLLWTDGNTWRCDTVNVLEQYVGLKAESIVLKQVQRLSYEAYTMLCIIACMGRFDRAIIVDWLGGDTVKMKQLLDEAKDAGVIEADDNEVRFSEMQIGEMIYNELAESRKLELHYRIANLLHARGLENLGPTEIVLMASSFNSSLDSVTADGKLALAAELNYKAAKISQQNTAFDQARYFFKMSTELLRKCEWVQVQEFGWQVYMDRAWLEYNLGEYDLAEIHLDHLLELVADPLKRSKIFELKVIINNHLGRYQKGVRILKESLGELGLELPLDEHSLQGELKKLKHTLSHHDDLNNVTSTNDTLNGLHVDAILKLLYVGGMSLHHTSDVLMTWAALQIILRSGKASTSVVKAIGYVSYGRMQIIGGDIEKGFEYGTKGLTINRQLNDITLRCRVFGVYAFYIQPWKKAFSESNALLKEADEAGRKAGDLIGLYILKTHQFNLHFISGLSLQYLLELDFEESYPGMELTYYITHYQKSLIKFLTGASEVFSIPRQNPPSLSAQLTIQEEKFYRNYVWARYYFLFGHYELAARAAQEAHDNRKLQEASPLLPANLITWFLSVTQNWDNYLEETREALRPRIGEVLRSFETWARHAPLNYEANFLLLLAEWYRIEKRDSESASFYQKALDASGTDLYQRGVTHELWAKYLLSNRDEQDGVRHLLASIRSFDSWGAQAKVRQLLQQYGSIIPERMRYRGQMDIETLQYELSGDMEVTSLVKKLMVLLLRISGSTHVVIELLEETGDRVVYEELSLLNHLSGKSAGIPVSLIMMALKSQSTVIVNDTKSEKLWRDQDALQSRGVESLMILPVTVSGHLSMVVYLENTFSKHWYVQERVKAIRVTANQGAVILENARIHEKSVKLNEELRREMAERERLSSVIETQKDAHLKAVVQAQDNERKRIATDLHDSLGSLLSSVRLRFNGLQHDFAVKVPEKSARYSDTLSLLDEAIGELRQVSHRMVPVSLHRFGLKSALTTFIEQVNASGQLDIDLQILGYERRLSENLELAVYRICQELVQNVIKHAKATILRVQVIQHTDALNIIVEDNGIGMRKDNISSGLGFSTIQSKVNLFKGTFEIESQLGRGTMILIDFPLSDVN
jgi:signal transduction histidine kinase/predicted ATPase